MNARDPVEEAAEERWKKDRDAWLAYGRSRGFAVMMDPTYTHRIFAVMDRRITAHG